MIHEVKQMINQDQIDWLFDLHNNSSEYVELYGQRMLRHHPSTIGKLTVSSYTVDEFQHIIDIVVPQVEEIIKQPVEPVYNQILEYTAGGYLGPHYDGNPREPQYNNLSLVMPITNPDKYVGGNLIVNSRLTNLQPGDAMFYTFNVVHEVKPVRKGKRNVAHLRLRYGK